MITLCLTLTFFAVFTFVLSMFPPKSSSRATLQLEGMDVKTEKDKVPSKSILRKFALITRPLVTHDFRVRLQKDTRVAQISMSAEEFMFIKLVVIGLLVMMAYNLLGSEMLVFGVLISIAVGYMIPEFWLKGRIRRVKTEMVRELPDAVDLLGLCVNAGLDFMMALKWVVEKSRPSVVIVELNNVLQEISVGKPRREALRDLSKKYQLSDLSTFTRTLIQADKMGTSVSEALNILSEDMRLARFRRGEALALKAPMKMLLPLLVCIFPVVAILVAGPIFVDFLYNNPLQGLK